MKFLVTGAAGFIGANVAFHLLEKGHEVVGLDCFLTNLYSGEVKRSRVDALQAHDSFQFVEIDLRTDDFASHLSDVDVVINEAAMPGLEPSWTDYRTYQDCNVTVVQRLLEALRKKDGIHLVQISTSSVYGRNAVADEKSDTRPVSPYGATKLAAEQLISAYREEYHISSSVLRYFSVYGPGQRPDMAFAKFCRRLVKGQSVPITGDGSHRRSITYVSDVAQATLLAAEARLDGTVMNISGTWEIGLLDAISVLADEIGVTPDLDFGEPRRGDQNRTAGDSTLARCMLGWEPRVAPDEGLRLQARAAIRAYEGTPDDVFSLD